jgi:hypothetical protein
MVPVEGQSQENETTSQSKPGIRQQTLTLASKYQIPVSRNMKDALELQSRGKLDEAMFKYKIEERICRELENIEGLSHCLVHQATVLTISGDIDGAYEILEETYQLAVKGNLVELASDLKTYLTEYR